MASGDTANIELPTRLDSSFAADLYAQIDAHSGHDLTLGGENVGVLGGLCLQIIVAAQTEWARHDALFKIETPSDALRAFLESIGRDDLITAETACP